MTAQESLFYWFQNQKRDLPFRQNKVAYRIWVSEVMLQQTRVSAMLPLYNRFISKFPDVATLAKASEDEVLASWSGLGYYSRARNLRKAAIFLMSQYNGAFPKTLEEALQIPGIGPYTARAVLSIAYDKPYAVLDGNVKRVLSRLFLYESNILGPKADRELQALADDFLNVTHPGDHNQAMMELGATICLPQNPKCLLCPLRTICKASETEKTALIPIRESKKEKHILKGRILWMECSGEVLLIKTDGFRFLKGMYRLPMLFDSPYPTKEYEPDGLSLFLAEQMKGQVSRASIRHSITHHAMQLDLFFRNFTSKEREHLDASIGSDKEFLWVKMESLETYFPSSLARKTKKALESS
ncbi:A/G-specific adenine glycosylase [Leptospira ryugenii]|uniref:Adenine DNA glycosylase n=1 Tax=Leptospira ryugenii TaxID=1917863 RepID=A0A2P2DYB9_9LEPT|nr:A/G-specific adenine glycosylase [Leptospira ryugenii]GBF49628.1 A/G-specific adenine glycosylase [Leptospira ryugenii]